MRFALAAIALAATVSAQVIPSCAEPCIEHAIASTTDCQTSDNACLCVNLVAWTTAAIDCIISDCVNGVAEVIGEFNPGVNNACASGVSIF